MSDTLKERAHFDALAAQTGEVWWGATTPAAALRFGWRAKLIRDLLSPIGDPRVLEIGCGTGTFTKYVLAEMPALNLTGCDVSPKAVEIAGRRFADYVRTRFDVVDVTHMPYPGQSFDAVIGNAILHHVPLGDTLHECLRVLRPAGVVWFAEPNMMNPQIAVEKNVRFIGRRLENSDDETAFFRWGVARRLSGLGFSDVRVTPFDFLHPAVPRAFMRAVDSLGRLLERIPLLKEIAGSLLITAKK